MNKTEIVSDTAYHKTEPGDESDCQPDILVIGVFDISDLGPWSRRQGNMIFGRL